MDYLLTRDGVMSAFDHLSNVVKEDEKVFVGIVVHGYGGGFNGSQTDEFLLQTERISMRTVANRIEDVAKEANDVFVYNNSCFGGYLIDKIAGLHRSNMSLGNTVAMSGANHGLCVQACLTHFSQIVGRMGSEPEITPAQLFDLYGFEDTPVYTENGIEIEVEDESRYWEGTPGLGTTFSMNNPEGDADEDGVSNTEDNCMLDYNPRQLDCNENDLGDECDDDQTPCVMLTSLGTRAVATKYEMGNFKMYKNATPEYIDLSYKTMGEGVHDVQMRWCDCSPWDDDDMCRRRNCDMANLDSQYPLHFNHSQWHMMSLAKRRQDIVETKVPVRRIGRKSYHQIRVNCPMETSSWSRQGVDPWTGLITKHCTPEKHDYGQEYEYGRTWDWKNEIWWQANRTSFSRRDTDDEYRGYIWVRPERSNGVKEEEAFTNKFVKFKLQKPSWSHRVPSQEPIFVDERDWVKYDPVEDIVDPFEEPMVDDVKPLNPVVNQPVISGPMFR